MEGSSKRTYDCEGDALEARRLSTAPEARRPPTGKALENSGNRRVGFILEETEGTAGNEAPPEELKTEEASAATSPFFMPYAANDDDAAGGVEAGIESHDSDDESDDDSDSTEE
jgi:hypothetical protein